MNFFIFNRLVNKTNSSDKMKRSQKAFNDVTGNPENHIPSLVTDEDHQNTKMGLEILYHSVMNHVKLHPRSILATRKKDLTKAIKDLEKRCNNPKCVKCLPEKVIMIQFAILKPYLCEVMIEEGSMCCYSCVRRQLDTERFGKCSGCYEISYCSVECQKKDWPNHKPECKK